MGELADLVVAEAGDAEAIVASDYPLGAYEGVNVDGLDPLLIAALHSLLVERPFSDLLGEYEPVAQGSPSGPWLVRFPAELISALAIVHPENQPATAESWAATTQLQEAGWSAQDAEVFLARLVHFGQLASFENKELYLCAYD